MTKRVFIHAASMVNAIRQGKWTTEPPSWNQYPYDDFEISATVLRAVQTAEAFILLFRAFNPLFDERRFLVACGLVDEPVKKRR